MEIHNEIKKILSTHGLIAGADEAGRGCWAGPIVASAVILNPKTFIPDNIKITDSKKISEKNREKSFSWIMQNALCVNVSTASSQTIDFFGLGKTNLLVLRNSLIDLKIKPDFILVDGFSLDVSPFFSKSLPSKHLKVINGDQIIPAISAASIIAKVWRDNLMKNYAIQFPKYAFEKHKGYGTKLHNQLLSKYGICEIHRKSYMPIKIHIKNAKKKTPNQY